MTIKIEYNKPEGFDDWFVETLSDCIAKGIVEKAIQRIRDRDNTIGTSE